MKNLCVSAISFFIFWFIFSKACCTYDVAGYLKGLKEPGLMLLFSSLLIFIVSAAVLVYRRNSEIRRALLFRPDMEDKVIPVERTPIKQLSSEQNLSKRELIVLSITALITISVTSKSSPLYRFNDWVDPNCFLTMGRGIVNALVPYRDLIDRKGPLLYFLHSIAVLIDHDGFMGVFVIEVVGCFLFLLFGYKLIRLYVNETAIALIPLLSSIVYTSVSFNKGDSAEEFCMIFMVFSLYIGMDCLIRDFQISRVGMFITGVSAASVLFIKYTMFGFFIGWTAALIILMLTDGKHKELRTALLYLIAGGVLTSAVILTWFAYKGALTELIKVYFFDNIFNYDVFGKTETGIFYAVKNVIIYSLARGVKNLPVTILILSGLWFLLISGKRRELCLFLICLLFTVFFIYFKGALSYYSFCLSAFAPMGMICIFYLTEHIRCTGSGIRTDIAVILVSIVFLGLSPNIIYLSEEKSDIVQFKYRDIILREEDPAIINYDFQDGGFYNVCGLVPEIPWFFDTSSEHEKMIEAQNSYIRDRKPDFIVSMREISFPGYELVSSDQYYDRLYRTVSTYFLYRSDK